MKKLLFGFLILLNSIAYAQTNVYHPFPDSAVVWRESQDGLGFSCCCSGSVCVSEDEYQHFISGDTIIGSFTYNKVYKSGYWAEFIIGPANCPPGCINYSQTFYTNNYLGGLRQDVAQKKVYFIPQSTLLDSLIYDFDLITGDTLPPSWNNFASTNFVSSIDSILIGSNYHKRFNISAMGWPEYVSIIEGIGSTYGLLFPMNPPFEFINTLVCVTVNSQTIYPDTSTACQLVLEIFEPISEDIFSVSPNPFSNEITISSDGINLSNCEISVKNIAGQTAYYYTPANNSFSDAMTIDLSMLRNGIYFLDIKSGEIHHVSKIVKFNW